MADKFGLRAWTINLRTWIFGLTCLVFKTTYIDAEKPLCEGAFSFARMMLSPPLDKRNTRDKAKSLRIASERYIGELSARCLSTISRGRTLGNSLNIGRPSDLYSFILPSREKSPPLISETYAHRNGTSSILLYIMYAREEDPPLEKVRRILRLDLDIRRKLLYLCSRKSGGRAANDRV